MSDQLAWPGSNVETATSMQWLIDATRIAEPVFYLLAGMLFLAATLLLVVKTKCPGRLFLLSGLVVFAIAAVLWWPIALNPTLQHIVLSKLIVPSSALLCAMGFARVVWHLWRSPRIADES